LSRITLPDGSTVLLKTLVEAFPEAMLGPAHMAGHGKELGVLCKLLTRRACRSSATRTGRSRVSTQLGLRQDRGLADSRHARDRRVPPYILSDFGRA
jgi:hypothetical protein